MSPRRVQDLIAAWYGGSRERFLEENPSPVLVGLGVLSAPIVRAKAKTRTTYVMDFAHLSEEQVRTSPLIAGIAFPIESAAVSGKQTLTLGRGAECDVVLPDLSISEVHCTLGRHDGGWTLTDLGSTNGTAVNGSPLSPSSTRRLVDEDLVTVGRCSFLFYTPGRFFTYLQLERG